MVKNNPIFDGSDISLKMKEELKGLYNKIKVIDDKILELL
jgi:hypothetical protein